MLVVRLGIPSCQGHIELDFAVTTCGYSLHCRRGQPIRVLCQYVLADTELLPSTQVLDSYAPKLASAVYHTYEVAIFPVFLPAVGRQFRHCYSRVI